MLRGLSDLEGQQIWSTQNFFNFFYLQSAYKASQVKDSRQDGWRDDKIKCYVDTEESYTLSL